MTWLLLLAVAGLSGLAGLAHWIGWQLATRRVFPARLRFRRKRP